METTSQAPGFMVKGKGFRVGGLGYWKRTWKLVCRVQGLGRRVFKL